MLAMMLSPVDTRVLASLIEKEAAVPDSYPLTLTALRLACNQSTNRRPVVSYDDRTVEASLVSLKSMGLVRFVHPSHGARTIRYRHLADERFHLTTSEVIALSALALRGPQTVNEVRARIERLLPPGEEASVEAMLDTLAARSPEPLAMRLDRRPGESTHRWIALLGGPLDDAALSAFDEDAGLEGYVDSTSDLPRPTGPAAPSAPVAAAVPASPPDELAALSERVEQLAAVIGAVAARLERLERELGVPPPG
jgi:uncharacterized protein YceH (UPF0502 family)